ncbi:hypothetical protein ACFW9X_40445 [Streptomyces sp. NPDC059466]|uniref:hypothetical protein n=1 Tax=Streptomyces sp. NPDC059466 TaxID=3346843 RepID=UPI0036CEBE76
MSTDEGAAAGSRDEMWGTSVETEDMAAAVVDADGTVAGWTLGAQRRLGDEAEEG